MPLSSKDNLKNILHFTEYNFLSYIVGSQKKYPEENPFKTKDYKAIAHCFQDGCAPGPSLRRGETFEISNAKTSSQLPSPPSALIHGYRIAGSNILVTFTNLFYDNSA